MFQPGTIVRDGAGHIIDGVPFAGNVVPRASGSPSAPTCSRCTRESPGFAEFRRPRRTRAMSRYYYNNPSRLLKNQDLLRLDYAFSSKMNTYFRWVNDYQTGTEPKR